MNKKTSIIILLLMIPYYFIKILYDNANGKL